MKKIPGAWEVAVCALLLVGGWAHTVQAQVTSYGHEFTLNDADGKPVSLSDYEGYCVILNFWASWCGPCNSEAPELKALYDEYAGKGVMVLGLGVDENVAGAKAWREKFGFVTPVLSDPNGREFSKYGEDAIPLNIVMDRGKVIKLKEVGYARGLNRIRNAVENVLNMAPLAPTNLSAVYQGSNQFQLTWEAPFEADVAGWVVSYGPSESTVSGMIEVSGRDLRQTVVSLPEGEYYFSIQAKDMRDNQSASSNSALAGRVKPIGEISLNKSVFTTGDTMDVGFHIANPQSSDTNVDIYIVLQVANDYFFMNAAGEFVQYPAALTATLPAGFDLSGTLFSLPFSGPVMQVCGGWHMAVLQQGTVTVHSLDSASFCLN